MKIRPNGALFSVWMDVGLEEVGQQLLCPTVSCVLPEKTLQGSAGVIDNCFEGVANNLG